METFPDEGDMDMARSLATYRDVGYQYMLMPDAILQVSPLLIVMDTSKVSLMR